MNRAEDRAQQLGTHRVLAEGDFSIFFKTKTTKQKKSKSSENTGDR